MATTTVPKKNFPAGLAAWSATLTSVFLLLISISAVHGLSRGEHLLVIGLALLLNGIAIAWRHYQYRDIFLHVAYMGTLILYGLGTALL